MPVAALPELDRWILHRGQQLLARALAAYDEFAFHHVVQGLVNFCAVDLSALYLDVVKDRIYTGTALFLKMQQWSFREGAGLENPRIEGAAHCPSGCGLCNMHQSHTLLGQVDLTNRCNLSCPICSRMQTSKVT